MNNVLHIQKNSSVAELFSSERMMYHIGVGGRKDHLPKNGNKINI